MSGNLRDDCFVADDDMVTLEEASRRLNERLSPVVGKQSLDLPDCLGRILAEPILAPRHVPPHDNSAVDGYGVCFADLTPGRPTVLPIGARIPAGNVRQGRVPKGTAVRIFTGAALPDGVDTVFMQEDVTVSDNAVTLPPGIKHGANRRLCAEDVRRGQVILEQGRRLRPQDLGLAASVGVGRLTVYEPLRCAVFSTGDEVRDPSETAEEGAIFDANRYTLSGLLRLAGCRVSDVGILPDRQGPIREALAEAAQQHDLLITSGGVSVGDEDHVKDAVNALGHLHFWKLAIKPGRPVALGQVGQTTFIGLPGNPVAAMVTFLRIARPVIVKLSGGRYTPPPMIPVKAGFKVKKKVGRLEWLRVRLERESTGEVVARTFPSQGSGILTSMVWADGLVQLAEEQGPVDKGDWVDYIPFEEVWR